jgi:hypothetical protein
MSTGGAAIIVSILVQILKSRLPADLIPLAALLIGVLLVEGATIAVGLTAGTFAPIAAFNALLTGILAGASSIGLYEVQRPTGLLAPKE